MRCIWIALVGVARGGKPLVKIAGGGGAVDVVRRSDSMRVLVEVDANGADYGATPFDVCVFDSCDGDAVDSCARLAEPRQTVAVEMDFGRCLPGQHTVTAYAAVAGARDDCETAYRAGCAVAVPDLRAAAGPGGYDERAYTVAPDGDGARSWVDPRTPADDARASSDRWRRQAELIVAVVAGRGAGDVLEFGCGTMEVAAFLSPAVGAYACVEPNAFLTEAGLERAAAAPDASHWAALRRRAREGRLRVAHNADFDAATLARYGAPPDLAAAGAPAPATFDLVYAHSVVSHAGTRTLAAFFKAAAAYADPDRGLVVASLCLCAPCGGGVRDFGAAECADDGSLGWVRVLRRFFVPSSSTPWIRAGTR
jgi:SAM-dependent methyltransferase